jgi:hypothetical protein
MNSDFKSRIGFRLFPGLWILLGVFLIIGARLGWGWYNYPHQIKRLAKELSSINVIQKAPTVNHAGTLVGLIHTTERGMGIFIADAKSKTEQKLIEVNDVDYAPSGAWTFGWSPDDKFFAFSLTNLFFWDGKGNELISEVEVTNGIEPFAWVSSTACAYIDRTPKLNLIQLINGQWQPTASWDVPTRNGKPRFLLATGTNSLAWATDSAIWELNLDDKSPKRFCSTSPRTLGSLSYAKNTKSFLAIENTKHSPISSLTTIEENGDTNDVEQIPSATDAQWVNNGKGYAFISTGTENPLLTIRKDEASPEVKFFSDGHVWSMFCDPENPRVYALAAQKSEPAGIWKCETNYEDVACMVSPWGKQDINFHFQPDLVGWARFAQDGRNHNARFDLVPPADFSRKKKYPLVIGTASYEWTPIAHGIYAQCLANCGAYVALVNYTWDQKNPDTVYQITNNVLAVYNQLAANPNVDTNQVYLFGFSAGSVVMNELIKIYPDRWRGIMLLNPSPLPEAEVGMTDQVLVTAGSGEGEEGRFKQYQEQLLKIGIPMEWHIHANAQHVVRDQEAMNERTLYMGNMIFGN